MINGIIKAPQPVFNLVFWTIRWDEKLFLFEVIEVRNTEIVYREFISDVMLDDNQGFVPGEDLWNCFQGWHLINFGCKPRYMTIHRLLEVIEEKYPLGKGKGAEGIVRGVLRARLENAPHYIEHYNIFA